MAWILGNRFLDMEEMKVNAEIIFQYFHINGWSDNAIAGIMGNMQSESSLNPHIWEGLHEGNLDGGYGLTQWTPATKYIDWAGSDWKMPEKELDRIQYEADNGIQWFGNPEAPITSPPISFKEFTTSDKSVEELANYFLWYYEHPAVTIQPQRAEQAKAWYEFIQAITPHPTPVVHKGLKVWQMIRYHL